MNTTKITKYKSALIIAISILFITPGFYRNQWLAAGKQWFYDWRMLQEGMVIARIVESRGSGAFSHGGLLGFGCTTTLTCGWESFDLNQEYVTYKDNGMFQSYLPYTSHPGAQGVFFSLFEQSTSFSPSLNLKLFHGLVSLLSAITLGLFIHWVYKELGAVAAISTLLFMALSEWLALFSGNIFWNIWALYLPLILSSLYLMKEAKTNKYNSFLFGLILATAMYVKCLFTGFEYITTALVMPLSPFVFYAVRDTWGWSKILKRIAQASTGLSIGVFAGLLTLTLQISQAKGGFSAATTIILDSFLKRSLGNPTQYAAEADSLKASLPQVLSIYINGRAISLGRIFNIESVTIDITYLHLFIVFFILTIVLFSISRLNRSPKSHSPISAIIITTWVSTLAPLSWFVIFKAHSFVHVQMNFIIWQMPFTLYGFALCGFTIERLFCRFQSKNTH